jgi:tRNA (guanine-N7-)-methyltransferase
VPPVFRYADAPRLPEGQDIDPRTLVPGGEGPVEIEIGPGRGGFLLDRLEAAPQARMIGLEIRLKWATIVDRRLGERGFGTRGRVFAEDARSALRRLRAGTVGSVFLHFPDPWWKKRQRKRLVASADLLREITRLLVPGGELFFQSDVAERAEQFDALACSEPLLRPWGATAYVADNPYGARSPRERRAIADGLPIVRLRYRRAATPSPVVALIAVPPP